MSNEQLPVHDWADEVALDELRKEASGPEDHAYLEQVDAELADSLKKGLGHDAVQLVQLQDGTVTTHDEVLREREAGHDMSSSHFGGRAS